MSSPRLMAREVVISTFLTAVPQVRLIHVTSTLGIVGLAAMKVLKIKSENKIAICALGFLLLSCVGVYRELNELTE